MTAWIILGLSRRSQFPFDACGHVSLSLFLILLHKYPDLPYFCILVPVDERTSRLTSAGFRGCEGLRATRYAGPTSIRVLAPFGPTDAPC